MLLENWVRVQYFVPRHTKKNTEKREIRARTECFTILVVSISGIDQEKDHRHLLPACSNYRSIRKNLAIRKFQNPKHQHNFLFPTPFSWCFERLLRCRNCMPICVVTYGHCFQPHERDLAEVILSQGRTEIQEFVLSEIYFTSK